MFKLRRSVEINSQRFKQAQNAEMNYWVRSWKGDGERERKAREYWSYYIGVLSKSVDLKPNDRILDIGCGPFGMINYLSLGERHGLDPLMHHYLEYFDILKEVRRVEGKGEHMPYENEYFDIVITTNTLDHTANPEKFLKEAHRILKKRCFLLLTVDTYRWPAKQIKVVNERVKRGDPAHPHAFTVNQVTGLLREAGFGVVNVSCGIGNLGVATRNTQSLALPRRRTLIGNFVRAAEIGRNQGCIELLRRSMRFAVSLRSILHVKYQGDHIFIAVKSQLNPENIWRA